MRRGYEEVIKMIRRGYGQGRGKGYYNMLPMDSHIHSLSAKGVRTFEQRLVRQGKVYKNPKGEGYVVDFSKWSKEDFDDAQRLKASGLSHQKIAEQLDKAGYTDKVDASTEISLFEYGLVRNPKTGKVIYAFVSPDDGRVLGYDWTIVSLEDVKEALNEVEDGYFSFIGSDKKTELDRLDNDYLTDTIQSLNMYNGYFNETMDYGVKDIRQLFAKGKPILRTSMKNNFH